MVKNFHTLCCKTGKVVCVLFLIGYLGLNLQFQADILKIFVCFFFFKRFKVR